MSNDVVVVGGVRSPFCRIGADLSGIGVVDLAASVSRSLMARLGVRPDVVDEVIMGCVCQPFDAANVARVIALRAGIPVDRPAFTVQRNCASGAEALTSAAVKIAAGEGEVFLVGGVESMTNIPLLFRKSAAAKFGALMKSRGLGRKVRSLLAFRPHDFSPVIGLQLGLSDPVSGLGMGQTAELLAREYGITRASQDEFANDSHAKAAAASARLAREIVPVFPPEGGRAVTADNGVRENSSVEGLARLRPVFDRRHGSVTAGNSSQISDGAAVMLVTTRTRAQREGWPILGALDGFVFTGCDPARMGLGPVHAIKRLVDRFGVKPDDCDVVEINEAFAVQVLAVLHGLESAGLGVPDGVLNPNGGAIALGHPVGASGARLVVTALHELNRRGGRHAIASMCIGGGQGGALLLSSGNSKGGADE